MDEAAEEAGRSRAEGSDTLLLNNSSSSGSLPPRWPLDRFTLVGAMCPHLMDHALLQTTCSDDWSQSSRRVVSSNKGPGQ